MAFHLHLNKKKRKKQAELGIFSQVQLIANDVMVHTHWPTGYQWRNQGTERHPGNEQSHKTILLLPDWRSRKRFKTTKLGLIHVNTWCIIYVISDGCLGCSLIAYPVPFHLAPLQIILQHTPVEVLIERLLIEQAVYRASGDEISADCRAERE